MLRAEVERRHCEWYTAWVQEREARRKQFDQELERYQQELDQELDQETAVRRERTRRMEAETAARIEAHNESMRKLCLIQQAHDLMHQERMLRRERALQEQSGGQKQRPPEILMQTHEHKQGRKTYSRSMCHNSKQTSGSGQHVSLPRRLQLAGLSKSRTKAVRPSVT